MTTPAALASAEKDRGNEAFKAGDFAASIRHYTAAVQHDPSSAVYPLNRAMAYLRLRKCAGRLGRVIRLELQSRFDDAERDCSTALRLQPQSPKALFRSVRKPLRLHPLE
jgi:tetratricopeptide (TPR) repeat protein